MNNAATWKQTKRAGWFFRTMWGHSFAGYRGYFIVVPRNLWAGLDQPQRQSILNHELTHIAQYDLWKVSAARILFAAQWFNPLAWVALNKYGEALELVCDELSKGETPEQHVEYSRALLSLVELSSPKTPTLLLADANSSPLYQRIENVLKPKGNEMKLTRMFVCALLVAFMLTGVLRVHLVAQEAEGSAGTKQAKVVNRRRHVANEVRLISETYFVGDLVPPEAIGITEKNFEELMGLIQATIDPDSWRANGGEGRQQPFPGNLSLIVTQTQENHDRLQNLLERIREVGTISIAMDAELLVMSPDDLALCRVNLDADRSTIISGMNARLLASYAASKETSERFRLPSANFFNGETVRYPTPNESEDQQSDSLFFFRKMNRNKPPIESEVAPYGGVDFSNIRIQGVKSVSQDIVRLTGLGIPNVDVRQTSDDGTISSYAGAWVENVPEGGFVAVDVSDHLIDKDSDRRALLILHVEIEFLQTEN